MLERGPAKEKGRMLSFKYRPEKRLAAWSVALGKHGFKSELWHWSSSDVFIWFFNISEF